MPATRLTDTEKGALAAQVRLTRESKGWGRERLAREAGISTRTVEKIEWGKITYPPMRITLIKLQSVLGLHLVEDYSEGITEAQAQAEIETGAIREDQLARDRAAAQLDAAPGREGYGYAGEADG